MSCASSILLKFLNNDVIGIVIDYLLITKEKVAKNKKKLVATIEEIATEPDDGLHNWLDPQYYEPWYFDIREDPVFNKDGEMTVRFKHEVAYFYCWQQNLRGERICSILEAREGVRGIRSLESYWGGDEQEWTKSNYDKFSEKEIRRLDRKWRAKWQMPKSLKKHSKEVRKDY